mmetsp:Transcript_84619/g.244593  ORF Transcript_84619/g.244593 Transcript_84619/m.244593 type:complete len:306 (+) Transcript_84619:990-1907(+)
MLSPVDEIAVEDVRRRLDVAAAVGGEAELLEEHQEVPELAVDVAEDLGRHGHADEGRLGLELPPAGGGEEPQPRSLSLLAHPEHLLKDLPVGQPPPIQAVLVPDLLPREPLRGLKNAAGQLVRLGVARRRQRSAPTTDGSDQGIQLHFLVDRIARHIGADHAPLPSREARLRRKHIATGPPQDGGLRPAIQHSSRKSVDRLPWTSGRVLDAGHEVVHRQRLLLQELPDVSLVEHADELLDGDGVLVEAHWRVAAPTVKVAGAPPGRSWRGVVLAIGARHPPFRAERLQRRQQLFRHLRDMGLPST